jgi:hypothetical protein
MKNIGLTQEIVKARPAGCLIEDAAAKSINLYEDFQPDFPDILYILSGDTIPSPPTAFAFTDRPPKTTGACQIILAAPWWSSRSTNNARRKTVAHETYHCVQAGVFGKDYNIGGHWWFEGLAEFSAYAVFPYLGLEGRRASLLNPSRAIYDAAHSTFLLFESLGQSIATWGVHDWVIHQTFTNTNEEERTILLNLGGFVDDFHMFAR